MAEEKFVIHGGKKIAGEIEVRGSKNAAFPVLIASLLTSEDCIISNLPLVEDIFRLLELFKSMKVEVTWLEDRKVKINASKIDPAKIDRELVLKFRGSVLLFGALLGRIGKAKLPQPGGCVIGVRAIDTHLDAFSQLGVKVEEKKGMFNLIAPEKLKNNQVILDEFSVTATANLLLFLSLRKGAVIIENADADYQNQELIKVLRKMGAKISGSGTHTLSIEGSGKLSGFSHSLIFDPIEAGTFIIMALATAGDVVVKNVEKEYLGFPLKKLRDCGAKIEIVEGEGGLASVHVLPSKGIVIKKVQSLPYPGFPSDLLSVVGVLATQTKGMTLIHDPLFEGRLRYMDGLTKMGADIFFSDPHRATINGRTKLYGADLGSFDLRAGAALIVAGLIAHGRTRISDIYQVDRGYEKIEERLQKLGADIRRVRD